MTMQAGELVFLHQTLIEYLAARHHPRQVAMAMVPRHLGISQTPDAATSADPAPRR
jgi:hypothetical protein